MIKQIDIEIRYIKTCPYCRDRKIIRKTCGDTRCQYIHHIKTMRLKRKTNRICSKRRVDV